MNRFCSLFSFDSSFNHLESLVLYECQSDLFISILNNLSCLISLTLKMFKGLTNLKNVYEITLKLSMLKYYNVLTEPSNLLISIPINIDQQFNFITHLVIENHCNFNNILTIISYTSQLYRLDYTNRNFNDRNIEINSSIKLANLKYLFIHIFNTKFDIFEMFLRKIDSKLKVFSFITRYEDITYLDANRWENLISKYLFQLEKFYLQYFASCEKDSQTQIYHGKPNQFISSFWIKRKWIFEVQRDLTSIIYSVRPYKKRWNEYIFKMRLKMFLQIFRNRLI
ncbi:unnamed protein product [Rotaria sp. Silwood1]|nr:unnamed protein product [Rotaria sp. Silwood1]